MTTLKKKIKQSRVTLTDKCLYFPCLSSRPETEEIPYIIPRYGIEKKKGILIVANDRNLNANLLKGILDYYNYPGDFSFYWGKAEIRQAINHKAEKLKRRFS